MRKRFGFGDYQYELVENWPRFEIEGGVADVACDADGRVYAAVRDKQEDGRLGTLLGGGGHVLVLSSSGDLESTWQHRGVSPHGLGVNAAGEMFLADTANHTITKHAPTGEVLLTLGTPGTPGALGTPFNLPTHAVEAPNGDIVVSDGYGQNKIHRFSADGHHILSFGEGDSVLLRQYGIGPEDGVAGTGLGEMNVPHDVYVDSEYRIYVLDRENDRWQVFAADGELLEICTGLNHPNKILRDSDGVFHLVGNGGVEVRRTDGTLLGRWGILGDGPGEFIRTIHGGWIDDQGFLYTAEVGVTNRLQKFARV